MRHWVRRAALPALVGLSASLAGLGLPSPALAVSPDIVISQVYGGGGNLNATYTNDFIELYNRGAAAVDVTGWSVQYTSAGGGSTDTDDNSADFTEGAPNPRNSGTIASADLTVDKADSDDPVQPGETLTYTITVTNDGPDPAENAELTDTLPAGTTFVSLTSPGGWTADTPPVGGTGTVSATMDSLDVGTAVFTLAVAVDAGATGSLSNTAKVASDTADPEPDGNASTETTAIGQPSADLAIRKTDAPDPVTAGSQLTYTVVVSNRGPDAAQDAVFTDPIPANTTFVSFTTPDGWTVSTPPVGGTGTVTASSSSFGVGDPGTFTLVVMVNPGATGMITNSSGITSATADPNTSDNGDSEDTTITAPGPACTITGTQRNDVLNGTPGNDVICGLGGNDIINGLGGNDTIHGGPGRDLISGGSGSDTVYGEDGGDILSVADRVRGNDTVDGGPGFDLCSADPLDGVLSCP